MKVKDLVKQLSEMNQELDVFVYNRIDEGADFAHAAIVKTPNYEETIDEPINLYTKYAIWKDWLREIGNPAEVVVIT